MTGSTKKTEQIFILYRIITVNESKTHSMLPFTIITITLAITLLIISNNSILDKFFKDIFCKVLES